MRPHPGHGDVSEDDTQRGWGGHDRKRWGETYTNRCHYYILYVNGAESQGLRARVIIVIFSILFAIDSTLLSGEALSGLTGLLESSNVKT